jgi:hypothetical protein
VCELGKVIKDYGQQQSGLGWIKKGQKIIADASTMDSVITKFKASLSSIVQLTAPLQQI